MARTIIVDGGEKIACPKCNHGFPLSEGISRQTIERYAGGTDRFWLATASWRDGWVSPRMWLRRWCSPRRRRRRL